MSLSVKTSFSKLLSKVTYSSTVGIFEFVIVLLSTNFTISFTGVSFGVFPVKNFPSYDFQ